MSASGTETFVPLKAGAPAKAGNAEFRVTVSQPAEKAQPFQPLGRPSGGLGNGVSQHACEPKVTLQRQGDQITGIHIQCTCGQVIELDCVFQ